MYKRQLELFVIPVMVQVFTVVLAVVLVGAGGQMIKAADRSCRQDGRMTHIEYNHSEARLAASGCALVVIGYLGMALAVAHAVFQIMVSGGVSQWL